jgi:hypothetical protein
MPAFIKNLTVDCVDALRVARFWAAALGSDVDEDSTSARAYVEAAAWGGPNIWFRGGRGPKVAANRMHLDLRSLTGMDEEVARLVGLGATVVERLDDITVMADPEGSEFCVEPGPDDPIRRRGAERPGPLLPGEAAAPGAEAADGADAGADQADDRADEGEEDDVGVAGHPHPVGQDDRGRRQPEEEQAADPPALLPDRPGHPTSRSLLSAV